MRLWGRLALVAALLVPTSCLTIAAGQELVTTGPEEGPDGDIRAWNRVDLSVPPDFWLGGADLNGDGTVVLAYLFSDESEAFMRHDLESGASEVFTTQTWLDRAGNARTPPWASPDWRAEARFTSRDGAAIATPDLEGAGFQATPDGRWFLGIQPLREDRYVLYAIEAASKTGVELSRSLQGGVDIAADGSLVAWYDSSSLLASDTDPVMDVYAWSPRSNDLVLVSAPTVGFAGVGMDPNYPLPRTVTVSDDGSFVAFDATSTPEGEGDDRGPRTYLFTTAAGTLTPVSGAYDEDNVLMPTIEGGHYLLTRDLSGGLHEVDLRTGTRRLLLGVAQCPLAPCSDFQLADVSASGDNSRIIIVGDEGEGTATAYVAPWRGGASEQEKRAGMPGFGAALALLALLTIASRRH